MSALALPLFLGGLMLWGLLQGLDVFAALRDGARKGLLLLWDLLPSLLVLFPVLWLLRASGLPEDLERLLSPLLRRLGIPPETGLLMLLRPLSGSAALAEAGELISRWGPDSLTHRRGHAGLQRDHLLRGGGLSGRRGRAPQPLGHSGGPVRGSGLFPLLRLDLPSALGLVKATGL